MKLPIAEIFHSIQGEGVWTGAPMLFVRLAGCNVGKYTGGKELVALTDADQNRMVLGQHSQCETVDGRRFCCDTNYHRSQELSPEEALEGLWEKHVCITGGEPFLHKGGHLESLIAACHGRGTKVHIETSGTLPMENPTRGYTWITCSPKTGFLKGNTSVIDEWKFVIGPDYDEGKILETVTNSLAPVYIQPVNTIETIYRSHLNLCQELQRKHPEWRISVQLHKLFGLQ